MGLGAWIHPRSNTARGCRCPHGTTKTFAGKFGIRCGAVRRVAGGRKRWTFVKMPKKCNKA